MADNDLLEMILFTLLPADEVKPVAYRLIKCFGDLNNILAASEDRLFNIIGVTSEIVACLKVFESVGHRMARAKVMFRPALDSSENLISYLFTALSYLETERVRVLYLDKKNYLVADEEVARGTVDHVPVYPREIVRRAISFNASAIILVHNHPSGDPHPSDEDISMTYAIMAAVGTIDLTLHDHIIVGKGAYYSFRDSGML